jgi:hypothetical protein
MSNSWNAFLKKHAGKGMSIKQLAKLYTGKQSGGHWDAAVPTLQELHAYEIDPVHFNQPRPSPLNFIPAHSIIAQIGQGVNVASKTDALDFFNYNSNVITNIINTEIDANRFILIDGMNLIRNTEFCAISSLLGSWGDLEQPWGSLALLKGLYNKVRKTRPNTRFHNEHLVSTRLLRRFLVNMLLLRSEDNVTYFITVKPDQDADPAPIRIYRNGTITVVLLNVTATAFDHNESDDLVLYTLFVFLRGFNLSAIRANVKIVTLDNYAWKIPGEDDPNLFRATFNIIYDPVQAQVTGPYMTLNQSVPRQLVVMNNFTVVPYNNNNINANVDNLSTYITRIQGSNIILPDIRNYINPGFAGLLDRFSPRTLENIIGEGITMDYPERYEAAAAAAAWAPPEAAAAAQVPPRVVPRKRRLSQRQQQQQQQQQQEQERERTKRPRRK